MFMETVISNGQTKEYLKPRKNILHCSYKIVSKVSYP